LARIWTFVSSFFGKKPYRHKRFAHPLKCTE
jgi:hypothetical protein